MISWHIRSVCKAFMVEDTEFPNWIFAFKLINAHKVLMLLWDAQFFLFFFFFYRFSVKSIKLFSKSWDIVNFWVQHFILICLCPMFCRLFWVQWSRSVKSRWKTEEWRTHRGENKQTTGPVFTAASSETVCKVLFFYCMKSCDNNIPRWGEFGRRRSSPTVKRGVA